MKTLIFHSLETLSAKKLALDLGGEVELRKNHYRIHTKKDFDIENHRLSSDVDLNIFDNNFDYQNIRLMVSDMDSTLITVETIDEVAKEVFEFTGKILGMSLANFVMFSSPEAIILFGGLTKAGDLILKPTRAHMEANVIEIFENKVKILLSHLKESDAAILGASALMWD